MSKAKFQKIYEDLRTRIVQRVYRPGERLPTERELARQYDVALLTLRQALRLLREEGLVESRRYHGTTVVNREESEQREVIDSSRIGEDRSVVTNQRANSAKRQSQGRIQAATKSDSGRERIIGVVVPIGSSSLSHPVFSRLIDGVEGVLTERGYQAEFVYSNPGNRVAERALKRTLRNSSAKGWLIPTTISSEVKSVFKEQALPCVLLHEADELFTPHLFQIDVIGLTRQIMNHLKRQNYRDIWVLAPEAMALWRSAVQRFSITDPEYSDMRVRAVETENFSAAVGQQVARWVLEQGSVDAFVCADDELAAGVLAALRDAGIKPPQVGVIGGGDFPLGELMRPALTTVAYPYYQAGREGGQLLVDILEGKQIEPAQRLFVPRLLVRGSSQRDPDAEKLIYEYK